MQAFGSCLVGMVEDQGRTELADRGGAVPFVPCQLQHGLLVQVITAEMLVHVGNDGIDLKERRHGAIGRAHRIAGIDRVRKISGVARDSGP